MIPPKGSGTMSDEESAPEWERIKSWVGSRNPQSKHPVIEHMEREQRKDNPHYDDGVGGGGVGSQDDPNTFDPNKILQEIAPPGVGTLTPSPARPTMQAPVQAPPPVPQPAAPVVQTPAPQAPIAPPQAPPQAAAPVTPDQQPKTTNDVFGGITPDTILQLEKSLNSQNKYGQIGAGIAGIGDAISKGVGRTDQNRMGETEQLLKDRRESAEKVPGAIASLGKERYGVGKELDADNPQSMKSFVAQKSYAPLLTKNGFSPQEIKQIPASAIEALAQGGLKASEIRNTYLLQKEIHGQTAAYQKGSLDLQKASLENTAENERAGRSLEGQKIQDEALKETANHPWQHPINARRASNAIAQEGGIGQGNYTPDVTAYAQRHGITPEQAQAVKDKRTGGQ